MPRLSQNPANLAPFIVTPRASSQARRVQSANTNANRPSESIREVGNETFVGVVFDPAEVAISVEANLVNARLLSMFANFDPSHTWSNKSLQTMIGDSDVDIHMMQRNTAMTAWLQSVYVRQASVASYRMAASTTASATETFEMTADNKTAFEKFVQVDHFVATGTNQNYFTLSTSPIALTRGQYTGNKLESAQMAQPSGSSTYLLETDDYSVSGTAVTVTNSTIYGQVLSGTQFAFAYQRASAPGGDNFQAKDTTSPAAIRGYYHIPVTITANSPNGMFARGMQSVEATMNFNATKEVGMGSQAVGASRDTPPEVTGNFVIFSENYDEGKLMIGGSTTAADDFPIDAYRTDIAIKLEFKNPDTHVVLRTDVLSGLTITGDAKDVVVNQQVGKQYTFGASAGFTWYITKNV